MSLTDIMSSMNLATLPTIAMIIFAVVFCAIIAHVASRKGAYTRQSMLPFDDSPAAAGTRDDRRTNL